MKFENLFHEMNVRQFMLFQDKMDMLSDAEMKSEGYYMVELISKISGKVYRYVISADHVFLAVQKALETCVCTCVTVHDVEGRSVPYADWKDDACDAQFINCKRYVDPEEPSESVFTDDLPENPFED